MRRAALAAILILVGGCTPATSSQRPADASVALPHTQAFGLHSKILDRDFQIYVAEPAGLEGKEKAAAVYTLDGDTSFGLVEQIARRLQGAGEMVPAYVIGIGYGAGPNRRDHEYLHDAADDVPDSGGGAGFERFLLEELRPLVEKRYPVDPARAVLSGHSFGGLFVANVLVRHPRAFSGWLISSGSLWVRDEAVTAAARRMSTAGPNRGGKVWLSVGEEEGPVMIDPMQRLADLLAAPAAGFSVTRKVWEGESHASVAGSAYARGLRTLLGPAHYGS